MQIFLSISKLFNEVNKRPIHHNFLSRLCTYCSHSIHKNKLYKNIKLLRIKETTKFSAQVPTKPWQPSSVKKQNHIHTKVISFRTTTTPQTSWQQTPSQSQKTVLADKSRWLTHLWLLFMSVEQDHMPPPLVLWHPIESTNCHSRVCSANFTKGDRESLHLHAPSIRQCSGVEEQWRILFGVLVLTPSHCRFERCWRTCFCTVICYFLGDKLNRIEHYNS